MDLKDERVQFVQAASQHLCQEELCMRKKELSRRRLLDLTALERTEVAAAALCLK